MPLSYNLIRSNKRKTIALQIKNAEITVRAPQHVSHEYIDQLIANKSSWIMKKLADSRQALSSPKPVYLPNNTILINGIPKNISVSYASKTTITVNEQAINIVLSLKNKETISNDEALEATIKKQLSKWMKQQLIDYLHVKLPALSSQVGLIPTAYKVRLYKARWGSCNNKHELSFNYLLTMAPNWVVDYVIIHELCHIKHLNHSAEFWQLVAEHMPNYKQASLWLKENQHQISW